MTFMEDRVVETDDVGVETDVGEELSGLAGRLRATFATGRTRPLTWRREQLAGLRRMLDRHHDDLIGSLEADLGRPAAEAIAADLGHTAAELRHLRGHAGRWMRPRRVGIPLAAFPGRAIVRPEPRGVALVIAPWNYPIQLLLEPMAAAIAAGNCVAGKPSPRAPASAAVIAEWLPHYVDAEAIVVVQGGVAEVSALLEDRWDHIFFTGSVAAGRIVAEAAARHVTPTVLELGGKSPAVVAADADLDVAARRIVWGKYFNAGQTCVAPDYVLVDRSVRDAFVARVVARITACFGDDPRSSASFGRLVDAAHAARILSLLTDGAGRVVAGGHGDGAARYVAPTVTLDPDPDGPLMTEEIFGPVLPVVTVDGVDEAVRFVAARPNPLALYVFSRSRRTVESVLDRTQSGGVGVNDCIMQLLPAGLPFGGVGHSGYGAYHGQSGFETFTHRRSVFRSGWRRLDLGLRYPPYSRLQESILRRVVR